MRNKGTFVGLDYGLNDVDLPSDCVLSMMMCNVCGHSVIFCNILPQVKVVGWLDSIVGDIDFAQLFLYLCYLH